MNRLTIKKFVLYLCVVFTLGAVTGGSFAWNAASRQRKHRPPPDPGKMSEGMKEFFKSRLALTPEQATSIEPFLQEFMRDLRAMQVESSKNFEAAAARFNSSITPLLNPEQRAKLEELDRERRDRFKRHGPPPPPSDKPRARGCATGEPEACQPVETSALRRRQGTTPGS